VIRIVRRGKPMRSRSAERARAAGRSAWR
jgi:hypothetical protein